MNDPAYCRRRAEEIKRLAEQVGESDLQRRLRAMGEEYEHMALRATVRVAAGILPPADAENSPDTPPQRRK